MLVTAALRCFRCLSIFAENPFNRLERFFPCNAIFFCRIFFDFPRCHILKLLNLISRNSTSLFCGFMQPLFFVRFVHHCGQVRIFRIIRPLLANGGTDARDGALVARGGLGTHRSRGSGSRCMFTLIYFTPSYIYDRSELWKADIDLSSHSFRHETSIAVVLG